MGDTFLIVYSQRRPVFCAKIGDLVPGFKSNTDLGRLLGGFWFVRVTGV